MHFGLLGNTSHSRELLIEAECLLVTFSFSFCHLLWSVNKLLSFDWIWHTTFSQQRDLFLVFNAFQCYQQYLAWGPLIKSELFFLTYPKFALSHMTASFPAGILVNDVWVTMQLKLSDLLCLQTFTIRIPAKAYFIFSAVELVTNSRMGKSISSHQSLACSLRRG